MHMRSKHTLHICILASDAAESHGYTHPFTIVLWAGRPPSPHTHPMLAQVDMRHNSNTFFSVPPVMYMSLTGRPGTLMYMLRDMHK